MPNVVGLTQAAATTAITGAGLTVGTVTTAIEHDGARRIGDQPDAGRRHAGQRPAARALVVSSGPPQVAVPNVVGLTQAAATTAITGAGLTVGTVTTASSTTVPAGSVISQSPVGGTQVNTGSAVALVVSSGLPQVAVPNVVGLTQSGGDDGDHGRGSDGRHGHHRVEHHGARGIGHQPDRRPRARRSATGSAVVARRVVGSAAGRGAERRRPDAERRRRRRSRARVSRSARSPPRRARRCRPDR